MSNPLGKGPYGDPFKGPLAPLMGATSNPSGVVDIISLCAITSDSWSH